MALRFITKDGRRIALNSTIINISDLESTAEQSGISDDSRKKLVAEKARRLKEAKEIGMKNQRNPLGLQIGDFVQFESSQGFSLSGRKGQIIELTKSLPHHKVDKAKIVLSFGAIVFGDLDELQKLSPTSLSTDLKDAINSSKKEASEGHFIE